MKKPGIMINSTPDGRTIVVAWAFYARLIDLDMANTTYFFFEMPKEVTDRDFSEGSIP